MTITLFSKLLIHFPPGIFPYYTGISPGNLRQAKEISVDRAKELFPGGLLVLTEQLHYRDYQPLR
jgi:hypothetical protein